MSSLKISFVSDYMDAEIVIRNPSHEVVNLLLDKVIGTNNPNIKVDSIDAVESGSIPKSWKHVKLEVLTGQADPRTYCKINLIKIVREVTNYYLEQAKALVESPNSFEFPYPFPYETEKEKTEVSNLIKQIVNCGPPVRVLKVEE